MAPTAAPPQPPPPTTAPPRGGPATQQLPPLPTPARPPAELDAPHSFVISLDDAAVSNRAPEPLPPVAVAQSQPRTQVLAMNQDLSWSNQIGQDAELLAIAKATGTAPGQTRRTAVLVATVIGIAVAIGLAIAGDEVKSIVERAVEGRTQRLGIIIVKTRPSPEDIVLDGKSRGSGNKKLTNVDVDVPHELVVTPRGQPTLRVSLSAADFVDVDGTPTWTLERDLVAPAPPSAE
jgi:hypothetical protein